MYDMMNIKNEIGLIVMITSIQNNFIKETRKLLTRKGRHNSQSFLIEGFHLLEEAIKSGWEVDHLIVRENINIPEWCEHIQTTYVSDNVFNHISQTETPQGIACIVKMKEVPIEKGDKILLIDAIQDPGNLGTIIRTADAAGFNHIILGKGTVDLYNDKVIRATQGSMFHVRIEQHHLVNVIEKLKQDDFTIYASALQDAISYKNIEQKERIALILGNEGAGISDDILQASDERIHIPIYGKAESLNVGVAAGILMYAFA